MRLLTFSVLFCISFVASSQDKWILSNTGYLELREKIRALTNSNVDSAFVCALQMEKSNNNIHKAFALGAKSYLFQLKGDSVSSKENYALAFRFLEKAEPSTEKTKVNAYLLNYGGLAEWKRLNLSNALRLYMEGKKLSEKAGDVIQVIKFNNNIASIYADSRNYRLAIASARQSDKLTDANLYLYEKEKYNQSKTTVSYKLGTFYESEFFVDKKKPLLLDSAAYFYKRTLTFSDNTATNNITAQLNLGNIYSYKGDVAKAEKMYLSLLKTNKDKVTIDNFKYLNVNLGELYFRQKKYKEALTCFKKVDSVHLINNNNSVAFYYANYYQARVYDALGEHAKALEYSKIFLELYSKTEEKLLQETIDVNFNIGKEASSKEILEIERANGRLVLITRILQLALAVSIVFIIVWLIRKNNQKKKDNLKAMKLIEEFRMQLDRKETVADVTSKKETQLLSIDEEKENEIVAKLKELEVKQVFLNQDFTQQFVAKKIKTNTAYLSHVVNKRFGKSFSEYANELKIDYVINQLISNATYRKYSTQAIAESAGFKKANSFTISFKKRTGLTPVQFAEKIDAEYPV